MGDVDVDEDSVYELGMCNAKDGECRNVAQSMLDFLSGPTIFGAVV